MLARHCQTYHQTLRQILRRTTCQSRWNPQLLVDRSPESRDIARTRGPGTPTPRRERPLSPPEPPPPS